MGMITLCLDVTNGKSIEAARNKIAQITNGELDILINNAYLLPFSAVPFLLRSVLT